MDNIRDIYRAVDYIENNLKENLSVEKIASHIDYSLYYFSRIFSKTTGHSPYEYIIRRRLSDSAYKLINGNQKIIDIAYEYQFNNPETFTRAFAKMFNYLPSQIKTKNDLKKLILKQAITKEYLDYINNSITNIKTEIVNKNDIYLVGIILNYNYSDNKQMINALKNAKESSENYVVYFKPVTYHHTQANLLAYKTHSLENTPSTYVGKKLPAQKYSKFIISAKNFKMEYIFQYLYQSKLKFTEIKVNTSYAIEKLNKNTANKTSRTIYIPIS